MLTEDTFEVEVVFFLILEITARNSYHCFKTCGFLQAISHNKVAQQWHWKVGDVRTALSAAGYYCCSKLDTLAGHEHLVLL